MKTSSLLFLAAGASLLLAFAPAQGEEKEAPAETPRKETRDDRATPKKERPPLPGRDKRPDRPERPERPEQAKRHERPGRADSSEKRPWVGVSTAPIDYALRDHLEIAEGFGIQVIEVLPDSPASTAGLRSNDIIIRFGDQRIISPEHLSLLVRTGKGGDQVALSIIRKGKEEVVDLTLGETDETRIPSRPGFESGSPYSRRHDYMRHRQDRWQDWMNQNRPEWRGHPPRRDENRAGRPEDSRGDRPQRPRTGRPPAISVNPGFPLRVFGSDGVLKIDNEKGELTLTREDKKHTLELKNAGGEVIYDGPFDPETGVAALPQEARDHLETMKLDNFEIRLPETPAEGSEKSGDSPEEEPDKTPESGIL